MRPTTFNLDESQYSKLQQFASDCSLPISVLLRELVDDFLTTEEDEGSNALEKGNKTSYQEIGEAGSDFIYPG